MEDKVKSRENDDLGREVRGRRTLEGKIDDVQDGIAIVTMYDEQGKVLHAKSKLSELQRFGIGEEGDKFDCVITRYTDGASVTLKPIPRLTPPEWKQLRQETRKKFESYGVSDDSP